MLNLSRVDGLVNNSWLEMPIAVAGVGAVGSVLVEQLALLGFKNIEIFDFDKVEDLNVTNQLYTNNVVGDYKAEACANMINARYFDEDDVQPISFTNGKFTCDKYYFAVFNCVDDLQAREEVLDMCKAQNVTYYAETYLGVYAYDAMVGVLDDTMVSECKKKYASLVDTPESDVTSPCGGKISCGFQVLQLVGRTVEAFVFHSNDAACKRTICLKDMQDLCVGGDRDVD